MPEALPAAARRTVAAAGHGRAPRGPTDDITVVTDRRYERLVREQVPDAALVLEPLGRNTAAAIALATLVIDRADDEVMVVLPADQTVEDVPVFQRVLGAAAEDLATGAFGIEDPLVTLGIQVDRPATEYGYLIPDVARGADIAGLRAYPLVALRGEAEAGPGRGAGQGRGRRLERRHLPVAPPRDPAALTRYTGLLQSLGPMVGTPASLERAYEAIQRPVSIDYAVMEGAAQSGQVVMASMDVGWSDLGSWSALLAALGARGTGAVVQAGGVGRGRPRRPHRPAHGGRLGVIAPPERGRMTATKPIAILRGTGPDRALVERAARALLRTGGLT